MKILGSQDSSGPGPLRSQQEGPWAWAHLRVTHPEISVLGTFLPGMSRFRKEKRSAIPQLLSWGHSDSLTSLEERQLPLWKEGREEGRGHR